MIWTSQPKLWPEGCEYGHLGAHLYGGYSIDAAGVRHDAATDHDDDFTWAMRIDTLTGEVVFALRDENQQVLCGWGGVLTGVGFLPAPVLLYSADDELLNPEDVPVSESVCV